MNYDQLQPKVSCDKFSLAYNWFGRLHDSSFEVDNHLNHHHHHHLWGGHLQLPGRVWFVRHPREHVQQFGRKAFLGFATSPSWAGCYTVLEIFFFASSKESERWISGFWPKRDRNVWSCLQVHLANDANKYHLMDCYHSLRWYTHTRRDRIHIFRENKFAAEPLLPFASLAMPAFDRWPLFCIIITIIILGSFAWLHLLQTFNVHFWDFGTAL